VCPEGVTRFPFSLPLRPHPENPATPLFETYHGINVNVQARATLQCERRADNSHQYGVAAELERSLVRGGKLSTVRIIWRPGAQVADACAGAHRVHHRGKGWRARGPGLLSLQAHRVLVAARRGGARGSDRKGRAISRFTQSQQYEGARLSSTALRITGRLDHGTVSIQRPVSGTMRVRTCGYWLPTGPLTYPPGGALRAATKEHRADARACRVVHGGRP